VAQRSRNTSSADWQSAVSRIDNPLRVRESDALPTASRRIQQVANLRCKRTSRVRSQEVHGEVARQLRTFAGQK